MKGKHFVSVEKKNGWFTVYINSEVINAKEPRSKFIDEEEAWENAFAYADVLKIGVKEK